MTEDNLVRVGVTVDCKVYFSTVPSQQEVMDAFRLVKSRWKFRQQGYDNQVFKNENELLDRIGKIDFLDPQNNFAVKKFLAILGGY
ncbi:MAG: hypothetical protein FADNKDHG_01400 [Holosporales bacterium]